MHIQKRTHAYTHTTHIPGGACGTRLVTEEIDVYTNFETPIASALEARLHFLNAYSAGAYGRSGEYEIGYSGFRKWCFVQENKEELNVMQHTATDCNMLI